MSFVQGESPMGFKKRRHWDCEEEQQQQAPASNNNTDEAHHHEGHGITHKHKKKRSQEDEDRDADESSGDDENIYASQSSTSTAGAHIDDDQMRFINTLASCIASKPSRNLFLTGVPGSGKTWVLMKARRALVEVDIRHRLADMKQDLAQTSNSNNNRVVKIDEEEVRRVVNRQYPIATPTALAASNIPGAKNLHALLGLYSTRGRGDGTSEELLHSTDEGKSVIKDMRILFYDECSMFHSGIFVLVDRLFRQVRGVNAPFGGVMVVLCGDFFQLPAVMPQNDPLLGCLKLGLGQQPPLLFQLPLWEEMQFETVVLTQPHRQTGDMAFAALLNRVRTNQLSEIDLRLLHSRTMPRDRFVQDQCSRGAALAITTSPEHRRIFVESRITDICFTNNDADVANLKGLQFCIQSATTATTTFSSTSHFAAPPTQPPILKRHIYKPCLFEAPKKLNVTTRTTLLSELITKCTTRGAVAPYTYGGGNKSSNTNSSHASSSAPTHFSFGKSPTVVTTASSKSHQDDAGGDGSGGPISYMSYQAASAQKSPYNLQKALTAGSGACKERTFVIGAKVMCTRNAPGNVGIWNGSKGVVTRFCSLSEWRAGMVSSFVGQMDDIDGDLAMLQEMLATPPQSHASSLGGGSKIALKNVDVVDMGDVVVQLRREAVTARNGSNGSATSSSVGGGKRKMVGTAVFPTSCAASLPSNDVVYPVVMFGKEGKEILIEPQVDTIEVPRTGNDKSYGGNSSTGSGATAAASSYYSYGLQLQLAYAFTVHSQQGQTLDSVYITPSAKFIQPGHIYVAISRAKSLDELALSHFQPSFIKADERVLAFYRTLIDK